MIGDLDALDATVAGAFLRAKKRPALAKAIEIAGPIRIVEFFVRYSYYSTKLF